MFSYYLRLAWSSVRRTPVLSALMVMALGLGIGAFMTTFTVYYLMSGNPIPHKSDVLFAVQLDNWDPNDDPTESAQDVQPQLTYGDGNTLMQSETPALRQVHMYASGAIVVPADETPPFDESVRATWHTFFEMFDVPFLYGQPWTLDDDEARAATVAAATAMSAAGHSWTSSTRISIEPRSKRAMHPRAFTHSYRRSPSGSSGARSA